MEIKSLGYQTDLIFAAFDGEIIERDHYLVVRTPSNLTFYWGNYLLFDNPPREGGYQRWLSLFAKEIGAPPQVAHQAFGWDSPTNEHGVIAPFPRRVFGSGSRLCWLPSNFIRRRTNCAG